MAATIGLWRARCDFVGKVVSQQTETSMWPCQVLDWKLQVLHRRIGCTMMDRASLGSRAANKRPKNDRLTVGSRDTPRNPRDDRAGIFWKPDQQRDDGMDIQLIPGKQTESSVRAPVGPAPRSERRCSIHAARMEPVNPGDALSYGSRRLAGTLSFRVWGVGRPDGHGSGGVGSRIWTCRWDGWELRVPCIGGLGSHLPREGRPGLSRHVGQTAAVV